MPKFWGITGPKSAQYTLKWAAAEFQEFAAVSRRILQTAPRNLAKFAAENCGPYYSYFNGHIRWKTTISLHWQFIFKPDGCIVWNAHNTVFGLKRSANCVQDVYLLHSMMPSVTYLWLCDVSVICRVTYLHFPIYACFSSMSVSQAAQRRTWFTLYLKYLWKYTLVLQSTVCKWGWQGVADIN